MILVAIVALSLVVLSAILVVFGNGLPAFPNEVTEAVNWVTGVLGQAASVFWAFVYPAPIKAMFGLTVAAVGIYEGYKLVMWVAKKVPMFGVSD